MAHLDELDDILVRAQRFENSVNAVAREPKNRVDSPMNEPLEQ
jgi:hypothetical protein